MRETLEAPEEICPIGQTLLLAVGRNQLLNCLPKGACVAEIGVYKGKFSAKILRRARPRHLALIDAWDVDVDRGHIPHLDQWTENRFGNLAKRLPYTLRLFNPMTKLTTHRGLSTTRVDDFSDEYFDWIYVDADHSHAGALADLKSWAPKVKSDGLIIGHDFTNQSSAKRDGFGVIEAVRDFIDQTDYRLLALSSDYFPSFILAKELSGPAEHFIQQLIQRQKTLVRISTRQALETQHTRFERQNGKTGLIADY